MSAKSYFLSGPSPIIVYTCQLVTCSCRIDLIDLTLTVEDDISKLDVVDVDVVAFSDD